MICEAKLRVGYVTSLFFTLKVLLESVIDEFIWVALCHTEMSQSNASYVCDKETLYQNVIDYSGPISFRHDKFSSLFPHNLIPYVLCINHWILGSTCGFMKIGTVDFFTGIRVFPERPHCGIFCSTSNGHKLVIVSSWIKFHVNLYLLSCFELKFDMTDNCIYLILKFKLQKNVNIVHKRKALLSKPESLWNVHEIRHRRWRMSFKGCDLGKNIQ